MVKKWAIWMCILCVILLGSACTPQPSLEEDIDAAIYKVKNSANGGTGNGLFRMDYVAGNFAWDKLYILPSGISSELTTKQLGFQWEKAEEIREMGKDFNIFVFVNGDDVVRWVKHDRSNSDFLPTSEALTPDTAVFLANQLEDGRWIFRPATSSGGVSG